MKSLIGMYECKADAKGRLMLPSGLKKQLAAELQEGFILKRSVFNNCWKLHPMAEWESIMADVKQAKSICKRTTTLSECLLRC